MENIENNTGFERFLDQVIAPIHVVSETCRSRSKAIVTETETGEVAFPTPKEMYESTKEAMSHAYGATYKLLMRMHDEEVVDGYHMRNLEEVYKAEEKALFEKFSAFQKFFEIPENLKEWEDGQIQIDEIWDIMIERIDTITSIMSLILRDRSSKSMEFYRNTLEQLEKIEKSYPDRPLTRKEKKRLERLFLQDRRAANARRKDLEDNKWQLLFENDALIQDEAHEAVSDDQAIRLTQIVRDRILTAAKMISLLDAFDQRYQSERSLVLERFEMHEMNPDRTQL